MMSPVIRTSGSWFIGPDGEPLILRGVCLGGWLNMENFITGYSGNESLMRTEVRRVIGDDRRSIWQMCADVAFEWYRPAGLHPMVTVRLTSVHRPVDAHRGALLASPIIAYRNRRGDSGDEKC